MVNIPILDEMNIVSISVRICLAILIGGCLGLERGRKRHPAGFRTYMLVCLGAAMVMMTNQYITDRYGGDPARLGAQVISGIGFLGAGTIMVTRRNQVKGLTTAAGLWTAACLGLAVGIGFYEGAIAGCIVILLIMTAFQKFDAWVLASARYMHVYAGFDSMKNFNTFLDRCGELSLKVRDIEISKSKVPKERGIFVIFMLENRKKMAHTDILSKLSQLEGLNHIEEL